MTKTGKDILRDTPHLKVTPYDVPEGYFDRLKQDLKINQPATVLVAPWKKISQYVAIAATFAMLIAAGGFFLTKNSDTDFSEEDYIVFSNNLTNTLSYDYEEFYAEAESVEIEDIIEYPIYIGAEVESIESEE